MIGAIENAMVAAITAADLGYKLRSVGSYRDELDDDIGRVIPQLPAAWVVFLGEEDLEDLGDGYRVSARFAVLAAAGGQRNEAERRHGADGQVGSYQIAQDLRRLLDGATFGLEIDRLAAGPIRPIARVSTGGLRASVMACELTTRYRVARGGLADPASLGSFQTFHADWDLPPVGSVSPPLPAASPDAADTVHLQGA